MAFAPREALTGEFVKRRRQAFSIAHDISAYSLVGLSRAALPFMEKNGGSIIAMSYLGAARVVPHYNVMGVAKASLEASVRYLANDLGPQKIRVNAISAGPMNTLAARGVGGFTRNAQALRGARAAAPQRRAGGTGRDRAFPRQRRRGRDHRPDALRRFRFLRHGDVSTRPAASCGAVADRIPFSDVCADSLLLWDIDGTLVYMDRAGERALLHADHANCTSAIFGEHLPVDLRGRTDTSIMRDLLALSRRARRRPRRQAVSRIAYLAHLPDDDAGRQGAPAAGHPARRSTPSHAHPEIHQALLTGNLREGARLKLSHLGIWNYFEFGAFADDSAIRNELGPFALPAREGKTRHRFSARARLHHRRHAARHRLRQGHRREDHRGGHRRFQRRAELSSHHPTHVFSDLSDTKALLGIVLG